LLEKFLLVGLIIAVGFPIILRPRKSASPSHPLGWEDLLLWALLSVAITSFVALLLLDFSRFFLSWLIAALGTVLLLEIILFLPRGRAPGGGKALIVGLKQPHRLLLLGILALGIWLRLPPSQFLFGGQDQGVYTNAAAYFLRTGEPLIHDPLLKEISTDPALAPLRVLIQTEVGEEKMVPHRYEGRRIIGFDIVDKARGLVAAQFLPLHQLWLAIFGLSFGLAGMFYELTFFALLSLLCCYYLCRRTIASPPVALFAAGLLAVNILQVWSNRYPLSETLAQMLLLAGLMLYARGKSRGDSRALGLGAVSLGLLAFTRGTAFALWPAFLLAFWLARAEKSNYRFFNIILLLNVAALAQIAYFNFPYLYRQVIDILRVAVTPRWYEMAAGGLAVLGAVNLLKFALEKPLWSRLRAGLSRRRSLVWFAAAGGLALIWLARSAHAALANSRVNGLSLWAGFDAPTNRLMQFSWYVGWVGLALALVGCYRFMQKASSRHLLLAGIIGFSAAIDLVFFLTSRYQFYYGRYYVTALLPLVLILLAAGLGELWQRGGPARKIAVAAAAVVLLQYLAPYFYNPAYRQQEAAGGYASCLALARAIPPGDITFINCPVGEYPVFYRRNATALMYAFGRNILAWEDREKSMNATAPLIRLLLRRGKKVNLVWGGRQPLTETVIAGDLWFEPVAAGEYSCKETERVFEIPHRLSRSHLPWQVFRAHLDPSGDRPIRVTFPSKISDTTLFSPGPAAQFSRGERRIRKSAGSKGPARWSGLQPAIANLAVAAAGTPLKMSFQLAGVFPEQGQAQVKVAVNRTVIYDQLLTGEILHRQRRIGPIAIPARLNTGKLNIALVITTRRAAGASGEKDSLLPPPGLDLTALVVQPAAGASAASGRNKPSPSGK